MPGAYTHLTMVSLLGTSNELLGLGGCTNAEIGQLLRYTKFLELGAVSPDYPYLHILSRHKNESTRWADTMHYTRVGDRILVGIAEIKKMSGAEKSKALCWLMGFMSHVITDVTIHPVVQLKVGPYDDNKTAHRVCEMNQDVYIYQKLGSGELTKEHLITGIGTCSDKDDEDKIDPVIYQTWSAMLQGSDPDQFAKEKPEIDSWHNSFNHIMNTTAPQNALFCWSRHMLSDIGALYPLKFDASYLENLTTPDGQLMHYDDIFEKAKVNVLRYWEILLRACIKQEDSDIENILNWNLDTGKDEHGNLTFWGTK